MAVDDAEAVRTAVGAVVRDFGRLDVFVANAGMAISKPVLDTTLDEYRQQMSVNGKWPSFPLAVRGAGLIARGSGRCLLLRQVCGRGVPQTGNGQPDHHVEHLGAHRQRARRPAGRSLHAGLQVRQAR